MAVLDKPGVVLVTRNVYVALTIVLVRVVALLVTVGAVPVTTTVYIPWLTPVSILPVISPLVVLRVSPLGRPEALVPPDVASAIYNIYGCNCITGWRTCCVGCNSYISLTYRYTCGCTSDKPGVVLVTRNVYVALTIVLVRVVALLVTVGAVPVTTTVYIPWLTPVSILPVILPEVVSILSPLGRPFALVPPDVTPVLVTV